jgi:UPF0755 protein
MKRWQIAAFASLLAVAIVTLTVVMFAVRSLNQPANIPSEGLAWQIENGQSFTQVSRELAQAGVINHPDWYRWYARYTGEATAIRAGEYRLLPGETPIDILHKLVAGQVELYSFTIVPGWTYRELLSAMAVSEIVQSSIEFEDWPAMLESFGAEQTHPEGLFLPETYRIPRNILDVDVLRQAYNLMQATLSAEWESRDENLPLATPYEALILASIIEKETAREDERPLIAGVFVRRLRNKMRLQTDPTVIYGIGADYDGNITRAHLRTDTPYNTYTRLDLPPTPIAMPGREAIRAALHPAPGKELYFVATGLGDGSHKFSETKDEHDAAVREYLARLRANKGRKQ